MVGSYHNQRFFGMLLIELVSHLDGVVHIHHFLKDCGGVVSVAGPVNLSTFNHQEETLVTAFGQERDGTFGNFGQRQVAFLAVDGIGQARRLCPFFLDKNHLVRLGRLRLVFVKASCNGIAGFFKDREDARSLFLIGSGSRFQETTACIEVETGFRQVEGYLVIHATVRLMGIECGGSSMVYTDAGSYPNFLTGLFGSLGHTLKHTLVIVHTNGAVVGLCTGSQGCSGSRRVSHRVGGRKGSCHAGNRERSEQQRLYTDAPFLFGQIHFRTVHLVHTHSITDEIKHVLRLLGIGHAAGQQYKEQHIH